METALKELARFDESARAALEVVTAFRELAAADAWDEVDVVRAMAKYASCPARIRLPANELYLRADEHARVTYDSTEPHPRWACEFVLEGEAASIWIERIGTMKLLDAAILNSAAELLRSARFRDSTQLLRENGDDFARLITCTEPKAMPALLERVGLTPKTRCIAIAQPGSRVSLRLIRSHHVPASPLTHPDQERRAFGDVRTGIGIEVNADSLRASWETAKIALAFAAENTDFDPGANVVHYEGLGPLGQLAHSMQDQNVFPDVNKLNRVIAETPWAARTLDALISHASLRLAAASLYTHHSTMQSRVSQLEQKLPWTLQSASGKLRLHLAMSIRRYLLHPVETGTVVSASTPIVDIQ